MFTFQYESHNNYKCVVKIAVTLVDQVNYIQTENWESHLKANIHIWTDKYKFDMTIGRLLSGLQYFLLNQLVVARANPQAMSQTMLGQLQFQAWINSNIESYIIRHQLLVFMHLWSLYD